MNATPPFLRELCEPTPVAVQEYFRTLEARVAALEATVQRLLERLQQDRGRRYPLAMCRVRAKQSMDHVVRILLARVVTLSIRITLVPLDRGFYSVRVIHDLITAELPFIMPAVKRGKKSTTPGGPTGTYAPAAATQGRWTRSPLKSARESHVAVDLAVVCHNTRGRRGRHQRETLQYAPWGVKHCPLRWIRATYRGRFGIESSYRQVHQAHIRTSSRNPALRLVFVGVALTLRNFWVGLHTEVMAVPRRGVQQLRPESMRFACLLRWLMIEVVHQYRLLRHVSVYRDIYEMAKAFGIIFNY